MEGFPAQEMCCKETLGDVCYLDVPDDLAVSLSDKLDLHLRDEVKEKESKSMEHEDEEDGKDEANEEVKE